jgi:hypothetical protein
MSWEFWLSILSGLGNVAQIVQLFIPGGIPVTEGSASAAGIAVPKRRLVAIGLLTALTMALAVIAVVRGRSSEPLVLLTTKQWESYPLTDVVHQKFSHETVELDGHRFVECDFDSVTFVYNGHPFAVQGGSAKEPNGIQSQNLRISNFLLFMRQADFLRPGSKHSALSNCA